MPADGPLVPIPFSLHPDYDRRPRDHTGTADLAARHRRSRTVTKRSRAMRIARNYRRWGVAPRPENVFAAGMFGGAAFLSHICGMRMANTGQSRCGTCGSGLAREDG